MQYFYTQSVAFCDFKLFACVTGTWWQSHLTDLQLDEGLRHLFFFFFHPLPQPSSSWDITYSHLLDTRVTVFYVSSGICLTLNKCFFVCVCTEWITFLLSLRKKKKKQEDFLKCRLSRCCDIPSVQPAHVSPSTRDDRGMCTVKIRKRPCLCTARHISSDNLLSRMWSLGASCLSTHRHDYILHTQLISMGGSYWKQPRLRWLAITVSELQGIDLHQYMGLCSCLCSTQVVLVSHTAQGTKSSLHLCCQAQWLQNKYDPVKWCWLWQIHSCHKKWNWDTSYRLKEPT